MDAGQVADLPEGVAGKRLPSWILPKVDNETRGKLRLDILIIEGLNTVPQENTTKYFKFINNLQNIKENTKIISLKYRRSLLHPKERGETRATQKSCIAIKG